MTLFIVKFTAVLLLNQAAPKFPVNLTIKLNYLAVLCSAFKCKIILLQLNESQNFTVKKFDEENLMAN